MVGRRHFDLLAQPPHDEALADHHVLAIDARPERPVLGLEIALPQRVAHDQHGLFEGQRLLDEVERAHLDGAHGRLDVAVAGDHHDLCIDAPLAQALQRHQTVDARQPHVEHDDVIGGPGGALEALLAARRGLDVQPFVAQHPAERRPHARFVVNDQNRWHQSSCTTPRRHRDTEKSRVSASAGHSLDLSVRLEHERQNFDS